MDNGTVKRLDTIMEDEVQKGYRIKVVPEHLRTMLTAQGGPAVERVRFTRLNPARRRKVAEVVQRQYHRDLQNPDVLSNEQLMKLVTDRGEWSEAKNDEMAKLRESVQRRMGVLYFAKNDADGNVLTELSIDVQAFRTRIDELAPEANREQMREILDRWADYSPVRRDDYTARYAALQGRETYSPDSDMQRLHVLGGNVEFRERLERIEELRDRVHDLISLRQDRIKLSGLEEKFAKIFSDSAEQRREVAEELSRVYVSCERIDADNKPLGPLVATFAELFDFPEEVIQWFQYEAYFFHNGIPDEAREYLTAIGFLPAEQDSKDTALQSSESEVSAESPVPPSSKTASELVAVTPAPSSESAPAMT